ncbi:hypothetical protein P5G62_007280 [Neobacillus sp. 179-C4.2 HS]|uniref:Uncharacterized protein n=1 Tax=Neobacillus driksii TaxID=3035913 RepID=A0ABV4YQS1_9BACI|nr:hypothetical protein [Neobacillus sp. 179.-C4.2 HS]MDP5195428.1 hypothetical protein [Neobacillus sp. 179.-C4.2 HS]
MEHELTSKGKISGDFPVKYRNERVTGILSGGFPLNSRKIFHFRIF